MIKTFDPQYLSNLEFLSLNNNQINKIPINIINNTSLKTLNLDKNRITEIPIEMKKLLNLTRFSIRDNYICNDDDMYIWFKNNLDWHIFI